MYLVIVHYYVRVTVFSVRRAVSWLGAWSPQNETQLSSHTGPFFIANPIYWHLKLRFSEIFD